MNNFLNGIKETTQNISAGISEGVKVTEDGDIIEPKSAVKRETKKAKTLLKTLFESRLIWYAVGTIVGVFNPAIGQMIKTIGGALTGAV